MNNILSESDRDELNRQVAETEKRVDAQIVLAVVRRSDSYPEIPWKAFALGTSVAGLITFVLNTIIPFWNSPALVLFSIAALLAVGLFFALIAITIPLVARLFISKQRAKEEVRQYAESVFLSRELYTTQNRKSVLLLVSLFERCVFVLPDKGLANRFGKTELHTVIDPMVVLLKQNKLRNAFEEGLSQLTAILVKNGPQAMVDRRNELSNEIIEEEGI